MWNNRRRTIIGRNNRDIALFTILFLLVATTTTGSIASITQCLPEYFYETYLRLLLLNSIFVAIMIMLCYSAVRLGEAKAGDIIVKLKHILLITTTYILSYKAIALFSSTYITNPFDTTGLRGFIYDLLKVGRIPSKGFYVEYAGAYNTLPMGPLLTSITYLLLYGYPNKASSFTDNLDVHMKFIEIIITFFNALMIYLFVKLIYARVNIETRDVAKETFLASFVIILLVMITILKGTALTLQYYAWPYLLVTHFILFRILVDSKPLISSLTLFLITLIALLNTHSVTNLLNTICFSIIAILLLLYPAKLYRKNAVFILLIIAIFGFFMKFFFDAVKYGRTFVEIVQELVIEILQGPRMSRQVEMLQHVSYALSPLDFLRLGLVRLPEIILKTFITMLMLIYGLVFNIIKNSTSTFGNQVFYRILNASYTIFIGLNIILPTLILLAGGNLYTAFAYSDIISIITLPLLFQAIMRFYLKRYVLLLLIATIFTGLVFGGNPLIVPKIGDQSLITFNINTAYKVNAINFLDAYVVACERGTSLAVSSDMVTGWQIMGYAPRLFYCYIWRSPVMEELSANTIVLLPYSEKAGYLAEPLIYRINASARIISLIARYKLIYNNGAISILTTE
uniref:Uncharacterized protein n=1 Tax=Ignisphaera aggregans TaxID=334771 RepID=A0A7J3YU83_9CREN